MQWPKGETTIYKAIRKKQRAPYYKPGVNSGASDV